MEQQKGPKNAQEKLSLSLFLLYMQTNGKNLLIYSCGIERNSFTRETVEGNEQEDEGEKKATHAQC